MSRRRRKVQRWILDHLEAHQAAHHPLDDWPSAGWWSELPPSAGWWSELPASWLPWPQLVVAWAGNEPTRAQIKALRRATQKLADKGWIEFPPGHAAIIAGVNERTERTLGCRLTPSNRAERAAWDAHYEHWQAATHVATRTDNWLDDPEGEHKFDLDPLPELVAAELPYWRERAAPILGWIDERLLAAATTVDEPASPRTRH